MAFPSRTGDVGEAQKYNARTRLSIPERAGRGILNGMSRLGFFREFRVAKPGFPQ